MCKTSWIFLRTIVMFLFAMSMFTAPTLAASPGMMMHPGSDEQMDEYGLNYMGRGPGWMGYMGSPMMGGDCGWGRGYGPGGYSQGGGFMRGSPMMGYLYGLNLTKEQRQKIRELRQKRRESKVRWMTQLMEYEDKLDDLYSQETPDPKGVGKVYEDIFSIRRQMIEDRIQERNSIYGLLTDEQKQKLKKIEPVVGRRSLMMTW